MSTKKEARNQGIVYLINSGISYRDISMVIGIAISRVEEINRVYNNEREKKTFKHCVLCGETTNLILDNKIRNICKRCAKNLINL